MAVEPADKIPVPACGYYLNTIYFYLTQGCNLRCRHCWIEPEFQGKNAPASAYISLDLFKKIIEQGKPLGLSGVKLTGGEPLLHPEISDILNYLRTEDQRLNIESNGVLCTKEIVNQVKQCKTPMISVSLDSPEPKIHEWVRGVKGSFNDALNGLKNIISAGISTQIIMSLMKKNVSQIEAMVHLAEELGVGSIKFNLVNPTARGKEMHDRGETLTIQELIQTGAWIENKLSKKTEVSLYYSHPLAFRPLSKIYGDSGVGLCSIKGIIGVLGTGKYALCGIGETVEEMIFGDAEKDALADIWNNSPILNDIRSGLPAKLTGICGDCVNNQTCLGSCVASNYYQSHDLFAPFWFCDVAYKKGFFPSSRIKPGSKSDR